MQRGQSAMTRLECYDTLRVHWRREAAEVAVRKAGTAGWHGLKPLHSVGDVEPGVLKDVLLVVVGALDGQSALTRIECTGRRRGVRACAAGGGVRSACDDTLRVPWRRRVVSRARC